MSVTEKTKHELFSVLARGVIPAVGAGCLGIAGLAAYGLVHLGGNELQAPFTKLVVLLAGGTILIVAAVVWRLVWFFRDVTKMLEQQREELVAASKLYDLGLMSNGLAHEINNPLAIVSGRARHLRILLGRQPFDVEMALNFVGVIEKGADRIARIVQGLRSFSRDSGRDPFSDGLIKKILDDVVELILHNLKNRSIQLHIEAYDASLALRCRASQIAQVLYNLINNAKDAIETLSEKWIRIEVRDLGDKVEIAVTDSGPGIPREILDKIMTPFYTTKDIGKGTGLGLSISRGIVEEHGGKLVVDANSPNTRFVVTLPKIPDASEATATAA